MLSLQCGALNPCECEKCWKGHRFGILARGEKYMLDWQADRIREIIADEWREERKRRWECYTKGRYPTYFK